MEFIPNAAGARLITARVEFDDQPPCAPHIALTECLIVAFQYDGQRCMPITLTGPVAFWGELRVSTGGAVVYGVTSGTGIETPDGARYASMAEFKARLLAMVGPRVREVRREKGWPEERLPQLSPAADSSAPG